MDPSDQSEKNDPAAGGEPPPTPDTSTDSAGESEEVTSNIEQRTPSLQHSNATADSSEPDTDESGAPSTPWQRLTAMWAPAAWLDEEWRLFKAAREPEFTRYNRLFVGELEEKPTWYIGRWLFLRGLGIIYLIAFASLGAQIIGLVGAEGILPAQPFLDAVQEKFGDERFGRFPTVCWWLGGSDAVLSGLCWAGAFFSLLLIAGVCPIPSLFALWALYLSLSTVSRVFLGYQWDILLLEVGFLAMFVAPGQLLPKFARERPPSLVAIWMLRWLLFRIMFSSGCVKLNSRDIVWRDGSALTYHYETQPIPNGLAWFVHNLPEGIHHFSLYAMFFIQLIAVWFIFTPRRTRWIGLFFMALLQVLILLTGSYCFFNILTLLLMLTLLDDVTLRRLVPTKWRELKQKQSQCSAATVAGRTTAALFLVLWLFPTTLIPLEQSVFRLSHDLTEKQEERIKWVRPFRTVNGYGLFATMTTSRPEIIIEGSNDKQEWKAYSFKWKPGDLNRRPTQVAPHQPRLDWQLWFEALNAMRERKPNGWFTSFLARLLEGSPEVLAMVDENPFPEAPPKYIRARTFDYHFTTPDERTQSGDWWRRDNERMYAGPALSLKK
jgi:hypothetical protein